MKKEFQDGMGLGRDWDWDWRGTEGPNGVCKVEKNKNPRKGQWTRLYVCWRQPLFQWFFLLDLISLDPDFPYYYYFFKPLWPSRLSHVDTLVEISLVRWCGVAAMLIRLKTLSDPGLPSRSGTSGYKPSGREKVGNHDAPRRTVF